VTESTNADRAWRIARWIVAGLVLAMSVGLIVLGVFAVHYAKKASATVHDQQTKQTEKKILADLSKTALLLTESKKVITETQKSATSAEKQLAASEAAAKKASTQARVTAKQIDTKVQANATQAKQLATEYQKNQKQIEQELASISSSTAAIQKELGQMSGAPTSPNSAKDTKASTQPGSA
jgi:hypothetical protein